MTFEFDTVPPNDRCMQTEAGQFRNWPDGDCFFGVPVDEQYGRQPLTQIPQHAAGFHFYLGTDQQALFDSYLASAWPACTRRLHIGSSCYRLGTGRDYARLTESLSRVDFPNLETLELGIWQLFSNSHRACGDVGCLDAFTSRMPRLRHLFLYGKCELNRPLSLPHLERLHVIADDPVTGMNAGAIDASTVDHLLRSSLPRLQELYVDLETDEDDIVYAIPDSLLTGRPFPELTTFELAGLFQPGTQQHLQQTPWFNHKTIKVHLGDMREREDHPNGHRR